MRALVRRWLRDLAAKPATLTDLDNRQCVDTWWDLRYS
jgi:hypothetical protein